MTKEEKDNYRDSFYWKRKVLRIYGRLVIKNIIKAFGVKKYIKEKL